MRIVIDTNVVISDTVFGGAPRRVVEAVVDGVIGASATPPLRGGRKLTPRLVPRLRHRA